jgi:lipoprotein-anchoring transpeptidase ErfK/SrfK
MDWWRRYAWVAAVLVALVAVGCGSSRGRSPEASYRYRTAGLVPVSFSAGKASSALASSAPRAVADGPPVEPARALPRGTSAVAWSRSRPVAVYRSPRARTPERRFPVHDQFGITQVFLVKRAVPGWLEVYLPVRPNDSTGWIRSAGVDLTLNRYRVLVNVAAHELTTLRAGRVIMHATVGVGKPATPTPHGLFYVIERLKMVPDTGPYGTYAFGLSAYSNVLKTFGTGDAQIALHGTDEPASIGQNWSNGCVHLPDSVADWLAKRLPLGTPVVIS